MLSVLQHFHVQLSHLSLYERRTLRDMLVPAPAAMTQPQQPDTTLDPGASNMATTLMEVNTDLAAISRRHAPGRSAYSADTLAALNDAATAAQEAQASRGKVPRNPRRARPAIPQNNHTVALLHFPSQELVKLQLTISHKQVKNSLV